MNTETGTGDFLNPAEREELRAMAEREGADEVARSFGIHREPFARAVAGFRLRRGTIALIRAGLARRALEPDAHAPPSAA